MTQPPASGRSGQAARREAFLAERAGAFDASALAAAIAVVQFPTGNAQRWVPIGPSVARASNKYSRYGQSTGRVRDLAVSADGRRAYAATAKGGVWYTDDAGAMWNPVGGWVQRPRQRGGVANAQACGCLLVSFGTDAAGHDSPADDFVLAGTGELMMFDRPPARPSLGGLGVLASRGPALAAAGGNPWEDESGLAVLEGLGAYRLARHPAARPGSTAGPDVDRVLVGTTDGLFLGTRGPAAAFTWAPFADAAVRALMGLPAAARPVVTDLLWLPGGADGRIVVALAVGIEAVQAVAPAGSGVAVSDDLGATFTWIDGLNGTLGAQRAVGRMSLAVTAANRLYALGEQVPGSPQVWRVDDITSAAPSATMLANVPALWSAGGKSQRDYDQAIAAETIAAGPPGVDRLYLGGSFFTSFEQVSSLWCFDVTAGALAPAAGIATAGPPPGGAGAQQAGLVGDDVHPDVHAIRLAGDAARRQVWVACDGGVYASARAGRVNTWAALTGGLASLEVNFLAPHPTSSHFVAAGTQDNGRHIRTGDVVWEDTSGGDGGGVVFHPVQSQIVVSQFHAGGWGCAPPTVSFVDPLSQTIPPVPSGADALTVREFDAAAFYSGAAAVRRPPSAGRIALGTNRVWLTDDLGTAAPNTWNVLPYPGGPAANPRPGGADAVADRIKGVPGGAPLPAAAAAPLGRVSTVRWNSPTELLALFDNGVVRWTEDPATGNWSTRLLVAPAGVALAPPVAGAPDPAASLLTDLHPVPGTRDFYLTTAGSFGTAAETCWFYDEATSTFTATELRHQLDQAPGTLGPLDPAYAVVVDPAVPTELYVGTVTGVWKGVRTPGVARHDWTPLLNGLPQAAVQDLAIWADPADPAGSPRLLRAALQARGVWEVDLTAAEEPQRTYVRVHARDDRRRFPTPMANPRRKPGTPDEPAFASPDVVVRPQASPPAAPSWQLGAGRITSGTRDYQLWTFQTAFRWIFPSVTANGDWRRDFGELVRLHRTVLGLSASAAIDKALWDKVVGGTHLDAADAVTASAADPLAVYRAPWQSAVLPSASATEPDITENVVFSRALAGVALVFREKSTVDVLIHHRDTRPLAAGDAFAMLLWRSAASAAALLAADVSAIPVWAQAAAASSPAPPDPPGWTIERVAGDPRHPLAVPLDARMPRAVSIDVDLSAVDAGKRVLLLAVVGSTADTCGAPAVALPAPATPVDLTRRWPYAAIRLVRVIKRPD